MVNFTLISLKLVRHQIGQKVIRIRETNLKSKIFQKVSKMLRRSPLVDFKSESVVRSVPDANANFDWEPSVGQTQKRNLKLDQLAYFMRQRQFDHVKALLGKFLSIKGIPGLYDPTL